MCERPSTLVLYTLKSSSTHIRSLPHGLEIMEYLVSLKPHAHVDGSYLSAHPERIFFYVMDGSLSSYLNSQFLKKTLS